MFSSVSGANANTSNITSIQSSIYPSGAGLTATITDAVTGSVIRTVGIQLGADAISDLSVGQSFPITSVTTGLTYGKAVVGYAEVSPGGTSNSKAWYATGGRVVVEAINGNRVLLHVENAMMQAYNGLGGAQSTGYWLLYDQHASRLLTQTTTKEAGEQIAPRPFLFVLTV